MNQKKAEKISKALADPNRLQILKEIKRQKQECLYCVDINDTLSLAQPSIAHHLKLLVDTEIIQSEKEGATSSTDSIIR
ncbi:MAG: metalloregulator ArsR/SmtB family transcription factor [Chryseolinea sp.]